jgi:hypothetical protein
MCSLTPSAEFGRVHQTVRQQTISPNAEAVAIAAFTNSGWCSLIILFIL